MSIFDSTARVSMQDKGIRFYEQDILPCSYIFEGDQVIDLTVDYLFSGFGVVIAQNNGHPFRHADRVYMLKVGYNDFQVLEKRNGKVSNISTTSCTLAPSLDNKRIKLQISIAKKLVSVDWLTEDKAGAFRRYNLGSYRMSDELEEYRIGFYSNAGNIIRNLSFKQDVPANWTTSIKNTCGGRIRFIKDAFLFENCENNAEIEQKEISLEPGKYYVRYQKELVNEQNDIKCIVMPTTAPHDDAHFEDDKKNLLQADGSFSLTVAGSVNIKFKGRNGLIRDVCITDNKDSSFVETEGLPITMDGSYITMELDGLKLIKWRGVIMNAPIVTSYAVRCPYGIVSTERQRLSMEEAEVELTEEYGYIYHVQAHKLQICTSNYEKVLKEIDINISEWEKSIDIFRNVTAFIYELTATNLDGETADFINQKTVVKYIPEQIDGPIIVTDDVGKSMDISASYREVVHGEETVAIYVSGKPMKIADNMPVNLLQMKLYGIPSAAKINPNGKTIDKVASIYQLIPQEAYHFEKEHFAIEKSYLQKYPHIAVAYRDLNDFSYIFTNYEREIFSDPTGRIVLEKKAMDNDNAILVYGIAKGAKVRTEWIYRIPNDKLINSIDLYADSYEIIPSSQYKINNLANEIQLDESIKDRYTSLVVDYLKDDSYSINYDEEMRQYSVDISSSDSKYKINYNGRKDGSMANSIATGIKADKSKYIILRRRRNK